MPDLLTLLIQHINAEQYAGHVYRALSCAADHRGLTGLAAWAARAADEEAAHARAFIDHARTRGKVLILPLQAPPDFCGEDDPRDAYRAALETALRLERGVAESLTRICRAGDDAATDLAAEYLRAEQWPAIHEIETLIRRLDIAADLRDFDEDLMEG